MPDCKDRGWVDLNSHPIPALLLQGHIPLILGVTEEATSSQWGLYSARKR